MTVLIIVLVIIVAVIISCLLTCKKNGEGYGDIITDYFGSPIEFPKQIPETIYSKKEPNDSCGNCNKARAKKCVEQGLKKELSKRELFNKYINGEYSDDKYQTLKTCLENAPLSNFCVSFCAQAGKYKDKCIKEMCQYDIAPLQNCYFTNCVKGCKEDDVNCIKQCQNSVINGQDPC
jgi:hypothetical protein